MYSKAQRYPQADDSLVGLSALDELKAFSFP
jgi:hypothetical protein